MNLLLTQGNALRIPLADESVHCVVTSPPYWGLRDYGTATWEGGDPKCDHIEGMRSSTYKTDDKHRDQKARELFGVQYRDTCGKCGAIRIDNQLGLEPTPDQYVENMVAVFREVKRVMRHDATCWINLGDSYATGGYSGDGNITNKDMSRYPGGWRTQPRAQGAMKTAGVGGLKPKDLCGIPWRVAFALQADGAASPAHMDTIRRMINAVTNSYETRDEWPDLIHAEVERLEREWIDAHRGGWWLRSDIIWSKPNPMPESVTDRPTKAHEYLFLLTKSARYFYDNDAVREPHIQSEIRKKPSPPPHDRGDQRQFKRQGLHDYLHPSGRNRRTVWHIATAPYSGAHFATYPPALVEPCIKAGTSERGVCPECGAPWERVVEKGERIQAHWNNTEQVKAKVAKGKHGATSVIETGSYQTYTTLGWRPTCDHYPHTERWREFPSQGEMTDIEYYWSTLNIRLERKILVEFWRKFESVSATIFDPFAGSGTTLQVARALGRNGIGLDLSLEYLHLARQRLSLDALDAWNDGVGQSENGKDSAHKNKQVPRQVHSFHKVRKEKGVTDLPMFGGQDEPR